MLGTRGAVAAGHLIGCAILSQPSSSRLGVSRVDREFLAMVATTTTPAIQSAGVTVIGIVARRALTVVIKSCRYTTGAGR